MTRPWRGRGGAGAGVLVVVAVALLALVGALVWVVGSPPAEAVGGTGASAGVDEAASVEASLAAARSYVEQEAFGKAEAVLVSAVGQFPEDVPLRLSLAEVLLLNGERSAEAYAQYEAALAIEPNSAPVQFQAGTLASTIGRDDRALEHYSMARSMDTEQASYALFLAAVQLRMGDVGAAKVNFLHALHLDESDATAAAALAQIALDENDRDLALSYARRARAIEPGVAAYVVLEARAHRRLADPEAALGLLLALPDESLFQSGVLTLAAECLGLQGKPGDAAALWAEAADADRGDAEKALQAGLWFERAGDRERAAAYASRAGMLGSEGAAALLGRIGG